MVVHLAHGFEGAHQLGQALQGVELALDGDEHRIAGAQAVEGEQIEAGRAVDEDEVVIAGHLGQRLPQAALPLGHIHQFHHRAGQLDVGGDDVHLVLGGNNGVGSLGLPDEQLVDAGLDVFLGDAEAAGGVALGVQVHNEDFFVLGGHTGRQIDRRGAFAHAALLVRNCNDFAHCRFPFVLCADMPASGAGPEKRAVLVIIAQPGLF